MDRRPRVPVPVPVALALFLAFAPAVGRAALFFPPDYLSVPGEQVLAMVAADFDGANGPDLALVSYHADSLTVLLNGGAGVFQAPLSYWAGEGPSALVTGDLDGDGLLDLAVASWDDRLRLFRGQGGGLFAPGADYATGDNPWKLVLADFNADGLADLACSALGGAPAVFSVYLNLGGGNFAVANVPTLSGQRGLAAGDFDGDGDSDLALALYATDQLALHLNDGQGHFGAAQALAVADKPYDLAASDLNGDTRADLLLIHKDAQRQIWALPGLGGGLFGAPMVWSADRDMDQLLLADLDADRRQDLLVTCSGAGSVGVLLQPADGNWQPPFFEDGGNGAYAPAAADFDGDGDLDLAVSSYWTDQLARLDNATFATPVAVSSFSAEPGPARVTLRWLVAEGEAPAFRVEVAPEAGGLTRSLEGEQLTGGQWQAVDTSPALLAGGRFVYRLLGRDPGEEWRELRSLSVELPATLTTLLPPWPNPASPEARVSFLLTAPARASLTICDALGRRLRALAEGPRPAGPQEFVWDGRDDAGRLLPSGVYLAVLKTAGFTQSRRVVLVR
jgi:hypothetical protein